MAGSALLVMTAPSKYNPPVLKYVLPGDVGPFGSAIGSVPITFCAADDTSVGVAADADPPFQTPTSHHPAVSDTGALNAGYGVGNADTLI